MIEVKREGTLVVLYINDKAQECWTMHELEERQRLLLKAQQIIREAFEKENKQRAVWRQNAVTLESYVAKAAGPNVRDYMFWDGSKTHPIMWPNFT